MSPITAWEKLQQNLHGEDFHQIYNDHFPIEVRQLLSPWFETKAWYDIFNFYLYIVIISYTFYKHHVKIINQHYLIEPIAFYNIKIKYLCPTLLYFNLIFSLNKQYISFIIPYILKIF